MSYSTNIIIGHAVYIGSCKTVYTSHVGRLNGYRFYVNKNICFIWYPFDYNLFSIFIYYICIHKKGQTVVIFIAVIFIFINQKVIFDC